MKKIVSLGIASAVLAMTALSASAVTVATGDKAETGKTITVNFTVDSAVPANGGIEFNITATGATLVAGSSTPSSALMGMMNDNADKYTGLAMNAAAAGTVLLTQTYTVTAKAGEEVTINVSNVNTEGFTEAGVTPLVVKVVDATSSSTSTSSSTTTSSSESSSSSSSSESTSSSTTSSESKPGTGEGNPGTGVALAVFPAVIAGAAVVVAKKKRG